MENLKKITFRYFSSFLEEETVETMWAEIINEEKGFYKLDNIPFYGPPIATDDIFYAEYDDFEENLTFKNLIEKSENSIIQVIILKNGFDKQIIREKLELMNCLSEGLNEKYFVIEIKQSIDYKLVNNLLIDYRNQKIIDFAEPVLSSKHFNDLQNNRNF